MKKDKEWAFIELGKLFPSHAEMHDFPDDTTVMKCELLNKVYDILKQLDQKETLSQAWIESNSIYASSDGVTEEYVHVDDLQTLIVPKQELPVIPEFVANWIEALRDTIYPHPLSAVYDGAYNENMKEWLFKGAKRTQRVNQDKLTRAWLYGFTIEKEQKYYVVNNDQGIMLIRRADVGDEEPITEAMTFFRFEDMSEVEKKSHRFTEKEIKDYDERYFAFAKPVEEVEAH